MIKHLFPIFLVIVTLLFSCSVDKKNTNYVDPFIGTGGHGHTYPGATLPFGMVQLSPDTRIDSWDGCSGYHYSDKTILGFSHTHLSGTGCGDYGDIRFMPTTGKIRLNPGSEENPESGYRSSFSHKNEEARPGYYSVELMDYDIEVELTTTLRTGFHKYIFPKTDSANVIIDLTESVTSDHIIELEIEFVSDREIQGERRTQGWAKDQNIFFNAEFSKPFKNYGIAVDGMLRKNINKAKAADLKAFVNFDTDKNEEVFVKVGISAVSMEGAKINRQKEIPGWNFDSIVNSANNIWEKELSKIEVFDKDKTNKTIFYTALYHALLNPNLFMDVDGKYRGHDKKIHQADDFEMYTVFSLWDTYRAAHPLFTIIEQERTNDFIKTMLKQYEQSGLLPVWELAGNETNCMIGYHSVPVIADAYMKNIRNYDVEEAFEAMKKSATQDQFGLKYYITKGYIPSDEEGESVSKTLEYAYDDWCIAQMAKALEKKSDYKNYIERAQYYKNIFDPSIGFMRAKVNESWFAPFDPAEVNFNYTEANSWQYSFYVPQDVSGLIQLIGGKENFIKKLDELFSVSSETTGRKQADITGLIGQYAHGNEPSHHLAYLYDYAGEPWKTQKIVRQIMQELYTDKPDGLCGNEDCGQMSAWYVFSAMGFYPVTPASNIYAIGSPLFDKVVIHLENGNDFVITAKNVSEKNIYIQSAELNVQRYFKSFITHEEIMNGGNMAFTMGTKPNEFWGTGKGDLPVSEINEHLITVVPFIKKGEKTFYDRQEIELAGIENNYSIEYQLIFENQKSKAKIYSTPVKITNSATITARAINKNSVSSKEITARFFKIPEGRKISIKNKYANQYSAGGDIALIDFQRGNNNFKTGMWQGYEGVDLEAVIDLGKVETIKKLKIGFLQDINAWIFMPLKVDYFYSTDGQNFRKLATVKSKVAENDRTVQTTDFTAGFKPVDTRYIKIITKSIGVCPEWHKGAGNPCWIFADEIVVE